jgi:hypothetical protein
MDAQVMGNYAEQKKQSNEINSNNFNSNANLNAQYRSVPRNAKLQDDNSIEITINTLSNQRASSYTAVFTMLQVAKTADETNTQLNALSNQGGRLILACVNPVMNTSAVWYNKTANIGAPETKTPI